MDAGRLARMRPGAILINTARGAIVDEPALVAALAAGPAWRTAERIAGQAGLALLAAIAVSAAVAAIVRWRPSDHRGRSQAKRPGDR